MGYQSGVPPNAWITIFGQNLAATTRAVTTSGLRDNTFPTTRGAVSIKIDTDIPGLLHIGQLRAAVQTAGALQGNIDLQLQQRRPRKPEM